MWQLVGDKVFFQFWINWTKRWGIKMYYYLLFWWILINWTHPESQSSTNPLMKQTCAGSNPCWLRIFHFITFIIFPSVPWNVQQVTLYDPSGVFYHPFKINYTDVWLFLFSYFGSGGGGWCPGCDGCINSLKSLWINRLQRTTVPQLHFDIWCDIK